MALGNSEGGRSEPSKTEPGHSQRAQAVTRLGLPDLREALEMESRARHTDVSDLPLPLLSLSFELGRWRSREAVTTKRPSPEKKADCETLQTWLGPGAGPRGPPGLHGVRVPLELADAGARSSLAEAQRRAEQKLFARASQSRAERSCEAVRSLRPSGDQLTSERAGS